MLHLSKPQFIHRDITAYMIPLLQLSSGSAAHYRVRSHFRSFPPVVRPTIVLDPTSTAFLW